MVVLGRRLAHNYDLERPRVAWSKYVKGHLLYAYAYAYTYAYTYACACDYFLCNFLLSDYVTCACHYFGVFCLCILQALEDMHVHVYVIAFCVFLSVYVVGLLGRRFTPCFSRRV